MKLTELELANFKVFGELTKIPVRPITLIFGPNSSGKSSLFQSLLLMKQTAASESSEGNSLVFKSSFADLGSYADLVHNHDVSKSISLGVSLDFSDESSVLQEFLDQTGLALETPEISFRTNFVSGSTAREGVVESIQAVLGDERLVFEAPAANTVSPDAHQEDGLQTSPQSYSATRMNISPKLSIGHELYDVIVEPLVKLALTRLDPKMDELRAQLAAAPDAQPKPIPKPMKGRLVFGVRTKADVKKDLRRYEKLSSILAAYTLETFKRDFETAISNARVDLRGCILDRSLEPDENTGILYPNFERLGEKSGFYTEKFEELLEEELSDDEFAPGDERRYTKTYFSLTKIWLLQLVLLGSDLYRRFLQRLLYIGPMRESPLRYYLPETIAGDSVGKTGEFSPTLLFQRPHLLLPVNKWLSRLKLDYELEVARFVAKPNDFEEGVFALRLKSGSRSISSSMVDVGFGVSQLLPIVIQCLLSQASTICIEQPELHLHPSLQAELGDLFIESALRGRQNRFIIETHSEHLILRLLRRIRETSEETLSSPDMRLTPSDVQVLYVRQEGDGAEVHDLEITADGEFASRWPDGFFPERAKELF